MFKKSFWKKLFEGIKGNEDFSELKESTFREFLNGSILNKRFISKQYKLIGLLVLISIFYINNRFANETAIEREVKLRKELQDVKFESLSISAELTKLSRRSFILDQIHKRGLDLIESPNAPIMIDKPNKKKDNKIIKERQEHQDATNRVIKDSTNNDETISQ